MRGHGGSGPAFETIVAAGPHSAVPHHRPTDASMRRGDLVVTPSMTWHDHGNEGNAPVMWTDGLDSPVVRYLELSEGLRTLQVEPPLRVVGLSARPRTLSTPARPLRGRWRR